MNVCLSTQGETNAFSKATQKGGAVLSSDSHEQLGVSVSSKYQ